MNHQFTQLVAPTPEELYLLDRLRPAGVPTEEQESRTEEFARVVWAHIAEPGDTVAVRCIDVFGAATALAHLVAGTNPSTMSADLQTEGNEFDGVLGARSLRTAFERWAPRLDRDAVLQSLRRAEATDMQLLLPGDVEWPEQVDDLQEHRPLTLWVRGHAAMLRRPSLAIVGSRACSAYGQQVTADIAEAAVQKNLIVVSGAAYGIDGAAHRAALACEGGTIAVLAGGVDRFYPREHTQLLQTIVQRGAVIAETPPGTAPTRWRFLQRNRIIAALSRATVITEAGHRSGSLNTAGHAAHLGRELAAVPGPITSAGSQGCFRIIREYGAHMFVRPSDIDFLVGWSTDEQVEGEVRELSIHQRTVDALPLRGSRPIPDIVKLAGLTPDEVLLSLVELELLGEVERIGDGAAVDASWKLSSRSR